MAPMGAPGPAPPRAGCAWGGARGGAPKFLEPTPVLWISEGFSAWPSAGEEPRSDKVFIKVACERGGAAGCA